MDLNGDGFVDVLSGSYSRSEGGVSKMAGLFQVLWGSKDGFKEAQPLNGADGQPLIIGSPADWTDQNITDRICTRPTAVDWDGNGNLDLVVGNFAGDFYLFKGEGKGVFGGKSERILADGKPLHVNSHGDPMVVDWDGDGDLDIVSGSAQGGVYLAENAGTRTAPKLKQFIELIKPVPFDEKGASAADLKGPSRDTRVWVDDVNGDGRLDLLVGDAVVLTSPAAGLSVAEMNARQEKWSQQYAELLKKHKAPGNSAADTEKINEAIQELYSSRREFISDVHSGSVWLYVQK